MSKNLKTLSFHLNSCENSINETDEHIEQENMKEHMNNLLQTLSQNKEKFQQLAQNQRNHVLEQKKYNNHLRSQYYNKDLVNRKQFKREIKSVSLFDEKQKFAHLPVSGIMGHRERFQSIQPERAKNPTTLVTDTNCRYFGQMPKKKLTQQQIDRIEFWKNQQETQKMYQYEELIINQTGSYKKDRLEKAIKVKPFIPPDLNEMNSIEKLETQMYALGKTSKNHFDQKTKEKIILQQSFDPYSTCDRFTIRHNLTDKKQMNTLQTLGDENSPLKNTKQSQDQLYQNLKSQRNLSSTQNNFLTPQKNSLQNEQKQNKALTSKRKTDTNLNKINKIPQFSTIQPNIKENRNLSTINYHQNQKQINPIKLKSQSLKQKIQQNQTHSQFQTNESKILFQNQGQPQPQPHQNQPKFLRNLNLTKNHFYSQKKKKSYNTQTYRENLQNSSQNLQNSFLNLNLLETKKKPDNSQNNTLISTNFTNTKYNININNNNINNSINNYTNNNTNNNPNNTNNFINNNINTTQNLLQNSALQNQINLMKNNQKNKYFSYIYNPNQNFSVNNSNSKFLSNNNTFQSQLFQIQNQNQNQNLTSNLNLNYSQNQSQNLSQNLTQNLNQNQNLNLSPVQIYLPTIEQSEKQKENFKKLQQFLQVENNWKPNQTKTETSFLNTIKLEQQKQENSPDPKIRICKKNQEQKLEVTLSNNNIKIYDF